jgi:hypothetical protein
MTDRLKNEEFIRLLAARMDADETTARAWLDGVFEKIPPLHSHAGIWPVRVHAPKEREVIHAQKS